MGRPKIGEKYKKPSDYTYDYPENRAIGKKLFNGDFSFIANRTGYSKGYVWRVLIKGIRNNKEIIDLACKLNSLRDEVMNKDC